ncbi:hypothetical protein DHEL01_v211177 [Diaporthe helianthi]|uniref:Uncharacterized protein n=1 Tax=Diaporthe helianthi TaxID=158607 RepID=A0A2P5HJK2_DIAHE|nr:hypothetical protein DHEL01_v211177 [Diaporthe helianthi]
MASNENLKSVHYVSAKPSVNFQIPGYNTPSCTESRRPVRRRKISLTALIIIAIALALLLAAVIVLGSTRRQNSGNDTPSENTNSTQADLPSPLSSSPEPPGGDRGLSWCQEEEDGTCTLGVYQNLDTGQIRAQIFDHTCRSLASSDRIQIEAAAAINSSLPGTVVLLIHGITGPSDEFWYNGTHYSDGWVWQNPTPVWYQTQRFACP